ncbi:MAG: hypothetical protein KDJ36_05950, partial [Hyphomicrobiaceae bacterium]|nr:hypothetical protein [Hyphomicrobiaceae bacterium]
NSGVPLLDALQGKNHSNSGVPLLDALQGKNHSNSGVPLLDALQGKSYSNSRGGAVSGEMGPQLISLSALRAFW